MEDPFELPSEFSLNSCHRFRWVKLRHTKRFLWSSRHLRSVLYS